MKNKWFVWLMIVVVIMSFGGCVSAATPEPTEEASGTVDQPEKTESVAEADVKVDVVKIGGLYPLTGSMALNGQTHQKAHEFAIDKINAAGGIACLGGAKLQMVYGDHQGKPEVGNAETERLITNEKVVAIMGVFDSGVGLTSTEIAEQYEVPYIVSSGVADVLVSRGLQFTFKTAVNLNQIAGDGVKFAKEKGAVNGVILVPNNTIGEFTSGAFDVAMTEYGIEILDTVIYPGGGTDFTDAILSMKSQNPEVIFAMGDTADNILLLRQMKELDYWPSLGFVTTGGGFSDPTFLESAGKDAVQGIFVVQDWYPSLDTPNSKETNQEFTEKYGIDLTGGLATTYSSTWLVAAALEKTCSLDPKSLAETLRTTKFEEGPWNMTVPYIQFAADGMNETTPYILAQWQDGQVVPVWPDFYKVGEAIWPMPSWGSR